MPKLSEIATIDGKPVYKDQNGDLCTDTNGFSFLRGLTREEESKLSKTLKAAMKLVEIRGDRKQQENR